VEPLHAPAPVRSMGGSASGSKPVVKRSVGAAPARGRASPVACALADPRASARAPSAAGSASENAAVARLTAEMQEMNVNLDGLEKCVGRGVGSR